MRFLILIGILLIVIPAAAVDGSATFFIKGVTVQDNSIFISNGTEVNLSYLPDHTEVVAAVNPGLTYVNALPDGWSEPVSLPAGEYTAYLRQGNGDQPEEQRFVIGEGITRVVFLGAAYASGDEGCCACHNVTVVDKEGYTVHHPEINHTEHRGEGCIAYRLVVDVPGHWDCISSQPRQVVGCVPTPTPTCTPVWVPEVNHLEEYSYVKEWDELIVDVPAWDEQIGAESHEERVCEQREVCPCGCVRGERG